MKKGRILFYTIFYIVLFFPPAISGVLYLVAKCLPNRWLNNKINRIEVTGIKYTEIIIETVGQENGKINFRKIRKAVKQLTKENDNGS